MTALNRYIFHGISLSFLLILFYLLLKGPGTFYAGAAVLVFLFSAVVITFLEVHPFVMLLAALLPLSIRMSIPGSGAELIFPGEALEGLLLMVFVLRFIIRDQRIDAGFLFHPVTIGLMCMLFFTVLSTAFSTMPGVSVKALIVRTLYAGVFYFLIHESIRTAPSRFLNYFMLYGASIAAVVLYTIYNHAGYQFSKDTSGIVALPFYSDHTIYSACIAFVLPFFILLAFNKSIGGFSLYARIFFMLLVLIFMAGIFFSLCRATWVSLVFGLLMVLLLRLKARPVHLLAGLAVIAAWLFAYSDAVIDNFKQNRYDSNARGAGIEEQTKSITNISNDQSNGERLNRWKCAVRMFEMKPFTGFGPGTYQFQYLPLQRKSDMTRISVTNPYHIKIGQGGTAHSEYLLALSEGGIFLFIFFVFTAAMAVFTAMKNYYRLRDRAGRLISGALVVGLVTYLVHGFFNNFLDTDKAAFLFWGAVSMIVTMDVYEKEKVKREFNQPD